MHRLRRRQFFPDPAFTGVLCALILLAAVPAGAGRMRGRVSDPQGLPVPGTRITIIQVGGELAPWVLTTDADGRYDITDILLFGNLEVTPSRAGMVFKPAQRSFFDPSGASTFTADFQGFNRPPTGATTITVDHTGVKFSATVDPLGLPTTVFFEHGPTPSLGHTTSVQVISGNSASDVKSVVFPVPDGAFVHARVVAQNALGRGEGPVAALGLPQFRARFSAGRTSATVSRALLPADFDGDGRMDFAWLGRFGLGDGSRPLFRSTGPEAWTPQPLCADCADDTGRNLFGATWLDLNQDGRPDLLASLDESGGERIDSVVENLINSGQGSLTYAGRISFGVQRMQILGADLNLDGRGDLLYATVLGSASLVNFATNGFVPESITQGGLDGRVTDLNGDGRPDYVTVFPNQEELLDVLVFPGNGTAVFPPGTNQFVVATLGGPIDALPSLHLADFDGDGALDILVASQANGVGRTDLLWNDGHGAFPTRFTTNSPGPVVQFGEAVPATTGDFDNDGLADAVVIGTPWLMISAPGRRVRVTPVEGLGSGLVDGVHLDADGDGRLDLLMASASTNGGACHVLRNSIAITNRPPGAPRNLRVERSDGDLLLRWDAGGDDLTPEGSLTWNVRAGTRPGASDLAAALADPVSGRRQVLEHGNAGPTRFLRLHLTNEPAQLFWTVQAVDAGYLGGAWAPEQASVLTGSFVLGPPRIAADGSVRIPGTGNGGQARLWASEDFQTWTDLGPFTRVGPQSFEASDPAPGGRRFRFYRATW